MKISQALRKRCHAFSEMAERVYKDEHIESRIDQLSRYYHYGYSGGMDPNPWDIHVNEVYPRVRQIMSGLFAKRPEIIAKPRRAVDTDAAKHAEILLNYLTRFLKLSRELREWLFWARLGMYGVMKLEMVKVKKMTLPTFTTMDPRAFRLDTTPDRFRPEEGQWQKFRYRRSLAQLRESGLYDEAALDDLAEKGAETHGASFSEETTPIWLWEHYVKNRNEVLIGTEVSGMEQKPSEFVGEDNLLWIREGQFKQGDVIGLPGRCLTFIPSPKTWYPVSPIEMWLDQQKEKNQLRTQKMIAVERSNPKILYDLNKIPEAERDKMQDPNPQIHIGVQVGPGGTVKDAMAPVPHSTVTPDLWAMEAEIDNTITMIDGGGSAQLGVESPKRGSTSATRDAIVENALRLRAGDNQEIWEEALEDAYQSLLNLAQVGMDGEMYLQIVGSMERNLNRKSIAGDIDVILSFGSTLPTDREGEWVRAKDFAETVAANPLLQGQFNPAWLARFIAQKEGDIKDIDQALLPQMPAMPTMPMGGLPGMPPGPPMDMGLGTPQANMTQIAQGAQTGMETPLSSAADLRNLF